MSRVRIAASIFFVALFAINAAGAQPRPQAAKDPCANATTQAEMNDCQGKEYKKADAELNAAYKQLMSKLDDDGERAALKAAQLAWIKFRDADCEYEAYLNKGGTIYPLVYGGCLTAVTQARTRQLRQQLKDR